jgi:hypothetical protein
VRAEFDLEKFEYAVTAPRVVVVRLSGYWRTASPPQDVGLVAWLGGQRVPLFLLPPPKKDGFVRAAFSTTPEMFEDRASTFALEFDGNTLRLPRPVKGRTRATDRDVQPARRRPKERQAASPPPPPPPPSEPRTEERLALELRESVGRTEQLMKRIEGYEQSRSAVESELESLRRQHAELLEQTRQQHAAELQAVRAQADTTQQELGAAINELRAANEQLAALHEAHAQEQAREPEPDPEAEAAAAAREEELRQELEAARAAAETASGSAEELLERLIERQALVDRARQDAESAQAETAEVRAAVERLRDELARRAENAAPRRGPVRFASGNPEVVERYREELRRYGTQIPALQRQAAALRDAIYAELPYHLRPSPDQQVLPLPDEQPPPGHDVLEEAS